MDNVKRAFQKVKRDMNFLGKEINFLKLNLNETRKKIVEISELIKKINKNTNATTSTENDTIPAHSTHPSTHNLPLEGLNHQNIPISIGNQGVPTDRQTDRQTDTNGKNDVLNNKNSIENAVKILDSLDSIKKEIRLKFKRLTEKELLVFSTLYQLDGEVGYSNYKTLSQRLNLTESSIRDYIGRLIRKGIPVEKNRINNKNVQLSISKDLKKIATLSTILQLRDL
ncbi:hypothetical protein ES703_93414 [subsurface metagenome]